MKRIFFAILLAAACSTKVNAQSTEKVDENAPEITFTSTEYDYGVVAVNSDGTRKFEFTNTGKQVMFRHHAAARLWSGPRILLSQAKREPLPLSTTQP